MGFRRYREPVHTLEQAVFADMPIRITCDGCGHFREMHAYPLMQKLSEKRKENGVNLWELVSGFYCRGCGKKTKAIISAPLQWV